MTITPEHAPSLVAPFYDALNCPAEKDVAALVQRSTSAAWRSYAGEDVRKDRDAFIQQVIGFGKLIPNLTWTINEIVVAGDRIVVRSEATGTPIGTFFGVPHGGGTFQSMTIDSHTVQDGMLVTADHIEDWATALRQLAAHEKESHMSSSTPAAFFPTVVRTVPRFPIPMLVFAYLLLLFNLLGLALFLFSINGIVPGLAGLSSSTVQQLSYRIAGRQLISILLFVFALTYKDVRVFQLAWAMALIREISDVAGFLATGESVLVLLIIYALFMMGEIAAFVYLGMIASGHVPKYLPQGLHMT